MMKDNKKNVDERMNQMQIEGQESSKKIICKDLS
jgi:hypothetical protein